ncbi:MAG: carbamoyltransferase HypF [Bacillota bacterium]
MNTVRWRLEVSGVVQGVGFRPYVVRLAHSLGLTGWVANDAAGVTIEAEGDPGGLEQFRVALVEDGPPLAVVCTVRAQPVKPRGSSGFIVKASATRQAGRGLVPPDTATCAECWSEYRDPSGRRYQYSFTNCTSCGPRYTIVCQLPYDRPRTTMATFRLCGDCRREYEDPADRRYHAQPVACPACGPNLELVETGRRLAGNQALERARQLLRDGMVLAVKGLGGFHLVASATDPRAVEEVRRLKQRPRQPLAVMAAGVTQADRAVAWSASERECAAGPVAPVVLARSQASSPVVPTVQPGLTRTGIMLPYTPLHQNLFAAGVEYLVMTSANVTGRPLAREEHEALALGPAGVLTHDRAIVQRCDDTVVQFQQGRMQVLRRARGLTPRPLPIPGRGDILAAGGDSAGALCLATGGQAVLSQHLGDLEDEQAARNYRETYQKLVSLLNARPAMVVCDMHPGYRSSELAASLAAGMKVPLGRVQHHHAHVAAVMAEHGLDGPVLGLAWDGTGLGQDGNLWGGEFLLWQGRRFARLAHLPYLPMPGGELCVQRPYRMAAACLYHYWGRTGLERAVRLLPDLSPLEAEAVARQSGRRWRIHRTSGAGRLFDIAAAFLGLCAHASYQGEAALLLECAAIPGEEAAYEYDLERTRLGVRVCLGRTWAGLLDDPAPGPVRAARFHKTLANLAVEVATGLARARGVGSVVLAGGVFQNQILAQGVREGLAANGLSVYEARLVPPGDGGLALGQAWLARQGGVTRCV